MPVRPANTGGGLTPQAPQVPATTIPFVPPSRVTGSTLQDANAELRAECEELRRRIAAVPRATQNAAVRIAELEKAVQSIRQARDSMLSKVHALTNKLEDS